jgi:hypothetical protein
MKTHRLSPVAAAFALALAACSPAPETPPADADADDSVADAASPAPPAAPSPPAAPAPPVPAADGPAYDPAMINFGGYRTAPFNSDEAALRAAYEGTLHALPPPETPDACYYLLPGAMGTDGYATGFMFEGGKFVRVDVDTDDLVAPGGLTTGMSADDVLAAFPDAEQQPHKYTEGRYLIVAPADGGEGRLVFEVDEDGRITEWRMGLEPQVHYVEGCS